jgi:hypothetical protein
MSSTSNKILDRYDEVHHYRYFDYMGRECDRYHSDSMNPEHKPIPVYEEEALFEEHGYKKIVSVDSFVMRMIYELSDCKYLYEDIIVGCLLAVSHRYWMKCEEPPSVVLNRCREALCNIYDIHPEVLKTDDVQSFVDSMEEG